MQTRGLVAALCGRVAIRASACRL